jgi:multidrug resistance efflux pump
MRSRGLVLLLIGLFLVVVSLIVFFLTGCSAIGNRTPEPLPTIVLGEQNAPGSTQSPAQGRSAGPVASGVVVPAQQSELVFTSGGKVQTVHVGANDQVQAGQVLVTLAGKEKLVAEVEAANLELLAAQQELDALYKDMDVRQAQALKTIADNQDAVRDAERTLYNLETESQGYDIDAAYANMILLRDKLERAQEDFEPYQNKPADNTTRAAFLSQLAQAEKEYDAAVRKYNNLLGTANAIDLSQAEANLAIAQADLAKSQRDYETLQKGPIPEDVALAQARLQTAEAQLEAAQSALEDIELRAPFDGTVTALDVHESEWVTPGQAVLRLIDLRVLRVDTTDLSERDVPFIEIGQPVTVNIKALNQDVTGRVSEIASLADTLGGDVVYKTTIELDSQPPGLRAGMSVEVHFEAGQ